MAELQTASGNSVFYTPDQPLFLALALQAEDEQMQNGNTGNATKTKHEEENISLTATQGGNAALSIKNTNLVFCHPHTAWQHADGCHEKLGL